MTVSPLLLALGSLLLGVALTLLFQKIINRNKSIVNLPDPEIDHIDCISATQVSIVGNIDSPPAVVRLENLHAEAFPDGGSEPTSIGTATACGTTFPLTYTLPSSLPPGRFRVKLWAEYTVLLSTTHARDSCSSSGSGSTSAMGGGRFISTARAADFEAIPRAYRVSPSSPLAGAGGSPAADLVGALSREREALLEYAPEASTPLEPVWHARGGPGPVVRWTLCLLHRHGEIGAVLSVVCPVGGREVQFTWVTNQWYFHTANRLMCATGEPDVPALLVRPA